MVDFQIIGGRASGPQRSLAGSMAKTEEVRQRELQATNSVGNTV